MTKYDFVRAWKNDASYDIEGPIICLTIEELEQVFAAGAMYGAARYHPEWEVRPDFKTYLTSKGISI